MASFNQDPNPTSDPSYLGLSQGTDRAKANTSMGDLFENLSKAGAGALKATAAIQRDVTYDKLEKGVEDIRNDLGLNEAADMAASGEAPTDMKGDSSNFLFSDGAGMKSGKGSPAGVARYGQRIGGLQAKYDRGELSESYYNARLLALTKEVKGQHSGWNEEIDGMIQKITGINPANALVRSLRSDMDAAERARTAGATKDETYLNAHLQYMLPETRGKIISGDRSPEVVAKAKMEAAGSQSRQFVVEQANRELELKTKAGKATEEDTTKVARLSVSEYVNGAFREMNGNAGGADGIMQKLKAHGDKDWTTQEKDGITSDFNSFRSQTLLGVDNMLAQPHYAQLPDSEKQSIRKTVNDRIDTVQQALLNKDTGALTRDARYIESIENADMKRLLDSNEFIRKAHAISKSAGAAAPEVINKTLLTPQGMNTYVKSINDLNNMELVSGEASSLRSQVQRQKEAGKTVPELRDPASFKLHIDNSVRGLLQTTDPEISKSYAKAMFSKENVGFLGEYKPKNQQQVFRALTSPAVDRKMAEIGGEEYKNYRDWTVNYGFRSQINRQISDIIETKKDASSVAEVTMDPKTGRFVVGVAPGKEELYRQLTIPKANGRAADPLASTRQAVSEINENIGIIEPILKREGGDPVKELQNVFKAIGYTNDMPKEPGLFGTLSKAVEGYLQPDKDPYGVKESKPLKYAPDALPKGKAVRPEGSDDSSAIDLDAGSLADISGRGGKLKDVILKAESGGDFNNVFGTSRKIPLTKMSLNEVMDLQGSMKAAGSPSTAVGGFQFLNSTLKGLKKDLNLKGDEIFDEKLQHRMADALLEKRGYGDYLAGKIGHKQLVNQLAQEWGRTSEYDREEPLRR
jgi:hypothetical protein